MNLADLYTKIKARITADTGSGGLYAAGAKLVQHVYFDVPLAGAPLPYILVTFPEALEDDTMPKDAVDVTIEFEIVCDRRLDQFDSDSAILDRHRQLFHRWKATLAGVYTATPMGRITGRVEKDNDFRRYVEQYRVRVEWNTAGPI